MNLPKVTIPSIPRPSGIKVPSAAAPKMTPAPPMPGPRTMRAPNASTAFREQASAYPASSHWSGK